MPAGPGQGSEGAAGDARPGQGATVAGLLRGWRRLAEHLGTLPQLPNPCRARHPAPNAQGGAAEGASLPVARAARREGGRKAKESGRVPTAPKQLTQEGRKAQEGSQQPHRCPSALCSLGNPGPASTKLPRPIPQRWPAAPSAGKSPWVLFWRLWGGREKGVQPRRPPPVPCAVSDAIQGLGVPGGAAKGVCGSWGAAPESAGDRSCRFALPSGRFSCDN